MRIRFGIPVTAPGPSENAAVPAVRQREKLDWQPLIVWNLQSRLLSLERTLSLGPIHVLPRGRRYRQHCQGL